MDVVMPQLGETVAEGTVVRWHKKVGDPVKADEALFDVETDKVSTEVPAPANGVIAEILVAEGVTAKVGTRLAVIRDSGAQLPAVSRQPSATQDSALSTRHSEAQPTASRQPSVRKAEGVGLISPVVSRLLAEHGLNARDIHGTGRDGRVTREDVLAHVARGAQPPAVSSQQPDARRQTPDASNQPNQPSAASRQPSAPNLAETEPLNSVRRRTAEHMAKSWTTVPHVLQVVETDFSRVDQARRAAARWKEREGFSLTYLPFVAWAVASALAKYPRLNASFGGDRLVLHRRVNLGIAVDLDHEGLMVPVVKDAAGKPLAALARAIQDVASRARAGKLRPDDVTGATYTISNNGAFGTLITAPIISPPQVAVLSTDAVRKRPVVIEGDAVAARPVGMLAQTFDHRAVDGAYSAAFLNEVKAIIETRDWQQDVKD